VTARLGLDLGTHELRLLQADGKRLTHHAEVLLPEGAVVDGIPTSLLTTTVRSALDAGGFTATRTRVAIAETGTAFRDFRLPRLAGGELARAVAFEGRRLVPMEASDVYFAWHATRDAKGYAVYLVAARRAMIDAVVMAVGAAGLQVERMDLKPLALARGMGVADGLLLEWGATEATLVLMVHGRPRFFRTFTLDAAPEDAEAQLDELALSLNALVKFMRGATSDVPITSATSLALGGRFAFMDNGLQRARQRFEFNVLLPLPLFTAPSDFPWQAHFAGIGLLRQGHWQNRLSPSQGGDTRVAA
jgi:hypothetical protein